jgi:DNA-binding CsgD family transcriptional regulator
MVELRRRGKSVKEIAELFGVSRRTVQRALKNQKLKVINQKQPRFYLTVAPDKDLEEETAKYKGDDNE